MNINKGTFKQHFIMVQFTLPFHNYLGPGNPINNGEPTNSADYIAKLHDKSYAIAKTKRDIFKADKKAINEFIADFYEKRTIGSLIGAAGLSIKHSVEKKLDKIIYPHLPGKYEEILYK